MAIRRRNAGRRGPAQFDDPGWLAGAERMPSPNFDERPAAMRISLLVMHNISLPPGEFGGDGVPKLFTNRLDTAAHPFYEKLAGLRVSAHFFVRRDGSLVQFVACDRRAWHAGASSWRGRDRCNDFSIGVELEGTDTRPYTARQYARLARLIGKLRRAYPIEALAGHSDIAPGRKTDPGPAFDWVRLASLLDAPLPDMPGVGAPRTRAHVAAPRRRRKATA